VFEPQRKARLGILSVRLSRKGDRFHEAELTVHPAYTFLYPELWHKCKNCARNATQSLHGMLLIINQNGKNI
jgi:hypothetical protein